MKKIVLLSAALLSIAAVSFAVPMSAGVKAEYAPIWDKTTYKIIGTETTAKTSMHTLAFGAFFDATYVQLGLDYVMSVGKQKINTAVSVAGLPIPPVDAEREPKLQALTASLLGKFPIGISGKLAIFPMLGFSYTRVLSAEVAGVKVNNETLNKMSDWYILGGIGLDVGFGKVYLRPTILYGINLTGKDEVRVGSFTLSDLKNFYGSTLKVGLSVGFNL